MENESIETENEHCRVVSTYYKRTCSDEVYYPTQKTANRLRREFLTEVYRKHWVIAKRCGCKDEKDFISKMINSKWGTSDDYVVIKKALLRRIMSLSPKLAYEYVKMCWREPCALLESCIATSPRYATFYAKDILHGRFRRAERLIRQDIYWRAVYYAIFKVDLIEELPDPKEKK